MKTSTGLALAVTALLPFAAFAEEDEGAQAPPPTQNINAYGNPTAAPHLPPTFSQDSVAPMAPTFPAASDKPSSRGGSVGDAPELRRDAPDTLGTRKQQFERERALPEPGEGTHTGTPPGVEASPGTPSDVNPGALQGGPQP